MSETTRYIPIKVAADQIGVTDSCLYTDSLKYRPFLRKFVSGEEEAGFDLKGFLAREELKTELVEKTRLLTEYLFHEEGVTYTEIGEIAGVTPQQISMCNFGYDTALKIAKGIRNVKPYHFERFHKYYGWGKK